MKNKAMKWEKRGLIFVPDNNFDWMVSHAQVPVVDKISDDVLRIYFGTRDNFNRTVTTYIEVEAENPQKILYIHDRPVLGLGKLGCFDDSGAQVSWILNYGGEKYLYYIGWNVGVTVPYRLSIGLAMNRGNGQILTRFSGPIMDRTYSEPLFCSGPCVIVENGIWKMWYVSCTRWETINGIPEPFYHIKYAESSDGVHWRRTGVVCINYDHFSDAIGRPCVFLENGIYKMLYSYRNAKNYRTDKEQSYRFGYAESLDGVNWLRKDDEVGIDRSDNGWDSEMIEYCYMYEYKGKKYMVYNGNGFGKSGLGYAVLEEA